MIELLAIAQLRNCVPEFGERVFGAILTQNVDECGDCFALVEPGTDLVEVASCGIKITEQFTVEIRKPIKKTDPRGEINTAYARQTRNQLLEALHKWNPGSDYGFVRYEGGGFAGVQNNQTRFRFAFSVEAKGCGEITPENRNKWNEMADG